MLRIKDLAVPPEGFLQDEPEGGDFYQALQASGIDGFRFGYFAVYRADRLVTVAPYFVMDFRLNTLLPNGWLKRSLSWIRFKLACIGNPTADFGRIQGEVSAEILAAINVELTKKGSLLAYKGFGKDLPLPGFAPAMGLPVPVLALGPDYYQAMKSDRRNLLKRKLKKAAALRYEECAGLPEHLVARVHELYLNTYHKAELKFEKLTREYFVNTSALSHYLLFFLEDELIGFTQLIGKGPQLVNRYVGLDYAKSNDYGLYFAMFIRAVDFGIREGFAEIELGATAYEFKRILGARQDPTWNYYQHTNPLLNWILGKLRSVLEPSESELR
ncbi:GNAT family N-acetyltransferase [Cupriavidus basilensis]|uniref:GNAT family N-acetyltransferase n=1 Tax=Cupriavidus basilensis TaxID=68895 RepID=A0ABT6APL2_9BURK|nr:GNAT family N-acetyltransferase [Cupriavidus basilensis]MDF3834547.1 GNAT family N-acetyltransferase [Cupriavidus basilensis]